MHCSLLEGGILDMHIWDSAQLVLAENEAFFFLHLPSSHVSWLEIIFFITRRLLLLLLSWEVQDLTPETCLHRHVIRSTLFIMVPAIIIPQQHHSQSGQTRWSWSQSNWIAVRFELKSLWKVQTFFTQHRRLQRVNWRRYNQYRSTVI